MSLLGPVMALLALVPTGEMTHSKPWVLEPANNRWFCALSQCWCYFSWGVRQHVWALILCQVYTQTEDSLGSLLTLLFNVCRISTGIFILANWIFTICSALIISVHLSLFFSLPAPLYPPFSTSPVVIHGIWFYDKEDCQRIAQRMKTWVLI